MKKIANFIIHNKVATYVAALLCICIWTSTFIVGGTNFSTPLSSTLQAILSIITYVTVGIYLIRTNDRSAFNIPHKASLIGTLFLMSCALVPQVADFRPLVQLILLSFACHLLLGTYRSHNSMGVYFIAFTLVSMTSLSTPTILLVSPILLSCCALLQSLHIRTVMAAIFGLLLPYWVTVCMLFLADVPIPIDTFLDSLISPTPTLQQTKIVDIYGYAFHLGSLQTLWLLLLVIPSIIVTFFSHSVPKARTQSNLYFLCIMMLTLLAFIAIFPSLYVTTLPLLLLSSSISSGIFFISTTSRGTRAYLIILLVVWIFIVALSAWNIYTIH